MNLPLRLLILCSFVINAAFAQQAGLTIVPLGDFNSVILDFIEQHPTLAQALHSRNSQFCPTTTLSLPFFDDFSNNPNPYPIYPDCAKWQDNHAYINQTMAHNPPSIGTATLDGLNPNGAPYNVNAGTNLPSAADTLTSQPIDLSGKTAGSNVILSYFYQPQGLSDRPEETDSLMVEFLDTANNWVRIKTYPGVSNFISQYTIPSFSQDFVHLTDGRFLHAGFQFRFRNLATITGNNDHWHIDYVYLDENRTDTVAPVYYNDVCLIKPPVSPFKDYTAVPWKHFDSALWNDSIKIYNFNHSNQTGPLNRLYKVEDLDPNNASPLLLNEPLAAFNYSPSPNTNDTKESLISNSFNSFSPDSSTLLVSTYIIENPAAFQNSPIYTGSDTARRITVLDNYFAYDDGTAETRVIASGIGTKIAVEFKTTVADTLQGIYFHLPYFTNRDAEQDFINVKVWVGTLNNEVYSNDIYRLRYVGGFNGFHYVQLTDFTGAVTPIPLAANETFYVGWQQASQTPVPVGFDRNSDMDHKTFQQIGGNAWTNTNLNGAIMIRPLLWKNQYPLLLPNEKVETAIKNEIDLVLYPNPTKDILYLQCNACEFGADLQIRVFNQLGQQLIANNFSAELNVMDLPQGIYYISLWQSGEMLTNKPFVKQ